MVGSFGGLDGHVHHEHDNIMGMVAKVGILPSIEGGWKTISVLHGGEEVPQRLGFFEKDQIILAGQD